MILGITFGILFLFLIIWLCVSYLLLAGTHRMTCNAFLDLHKQINKRYEMILALLNETSGNPDKVSETKNFIEKALNFNFKTDGADRIVRFANAIFDNTKLLSLQIEEDVHFTSAKNHYNHCTERLRHYIDVFPTSLMARFLNIKLMDSLR